MAHKHVGIQCDCCAQKDIVGIRWKCLNCTNYDLCMACHSEEGGRHSHGLHVFAEIRRPVTVMLDKGQPLLPLFYKSKPTMMTSDQSKPSTNTNTVMMDQIKLLSAVNVHYPDVTKVGMTRMLNSQNGRGWSGEDYDDGDREDNGGDGYK